MNFLALLSSEVYRNKKRIIIVLKFVSNAFTTVALQTVGIFLLCVQYSLKFAQNWQ